MSCQRSFYYRTSSIRAVVGGVPSRLRPAGFDAARCRWRAEGWAEAQLPEDQTTIRAWFLIARHSSLVTRHYPIVTRHLSLSWPITTRNPANRLNRSSRRARREVPQAEKRTSIARTALAAAQLSEDQTAIRAWFLIARHSSLVTRHSSLPQGHQRSAA